MCIPTYRRLNRFAVELFAWRYEHGAWPETIDLLSMPPEELVDPYDLNGSPFGYDIDTDDTCVIWSVGEDRVARMLEPADTSPSDDTVLVLPPLMPVKEAAE